MFRKLCAPLAAIVLGFSAGVAHAQSRPDANLDARFRAQAATPLRPAGASEALATGQGDLILLRRARLVTLEGNVTAADTDNAFLSDADEQRDTSATIDLAASARLRLGVRTSLSARIAASATRYEEFSELDYSAATATLAVQTHRVGVDWTAYYQRAELFDESFSDQQLTQNRFHVEAGRSVELGAWTIGASVYGERITADPEEYNNSALGLEASVSRPIPRAPQVTAFAQIAYERRRYDSFFEGLIGASRRDDGLSGTIGAAWTVTRNVQLVAGYSARQNRSSSDVNRYDSGSVFIGLSSRLQL